jgi:hypothetical protein
MRMFWTVYCQGMLLSECCYFDCWFGGLWCRALLLALFGAATAVCACRLSSCCCSVQVCWCVLLVFVCCAVLAVGSLLQQQSVWFAVLFWRLVVSFSSSLFGFGLFFLVVRVVVLVLTQGYACGCHMYIPASLLLGLASFVYGWFLRGFCSSHGLYGNRFPLVCFFFPLKLISASRTGLLANKIFAVSIKKKKLKFHQNKF